MKHYLGKTELALAFEKDLTFRLRKLKRENFDDYDYFRYFLIVGTPEDEFYTATRRVSKTSIDFDAHKIFTDTLAREAVFNDGSICEHRFLKCPVEGQFWYFAVTIEAYNSKEKVNVCPAPEFLQTLSDLNFQIL